MIAQQLGPIGKNAFILLLRHGLQHGVAGIEFQHRLHSSRN